jgi:hypothetical protein
MSLPQPIAQKQFAFDVSRTNGLACENRMECQRIFTFKVPFLIVVAQDNLLRLGVIAQFKAQM